MISPVMPTYARAPLAFERGEGSWLTATDGTKYLDFGAGIAVCALGHAHPKLVQALETQARRVWHVCNLYEIPEQTALAERLVAETFADTVFFTNSGTEAMEMAIKMVRKYWHAKGQPERHEIIAFEGAFHGRSTGAIAAVGAPKLVEGYGPLMPGFLQLPFGDHDALKAAMSDKTAAVFVEPVQGEGGIRPLDPACLRGLRALCDETGALMVLDEIQCGMGRTGKLFAHEHAGVTPDIMAVAKAIGGGFPLGALLATEAAAACMTAGSHGSTYGGNPLACAVGLAVMEEIADPAFLAGIARKGALLTQRLAGLAAAHPGLVAEIRGVGLMQGIRLAETCPVGEFIAAARAEGLILIPAADNVARVLPALTISDSEISEGVERLDKTLAQLEKSG